MQDLLTGKKRLPGFCGEWKWMTLDDVFTFSGGYTASRAQLSGRGHCYLHYGDIHTSASTVVDIGDPGHTVPRLDVPLKDVPAKSLLSDGDVVFVNASEDDEGASKHVVVRNPDGAPFIAGLHTIVAKPRSDTLDVVYQRYCFQTRDVKAQFLFFAVGTKVSGINKSNIARIKLPVLPRDEQAAIGAALADMDAELDAVDAQLLKARAIKQGMMQALLTGRIRLV